MILDGAPVRRAEPVVSLLVAVRNRPAKVRRTLRSVPWDRPRLEVVVVDDASTDETPAVVEREFGERITFVRHERRRGAGPTRNTAARTARGDWCLILDSDNELLDGALDVIEDAIGAWGERAGVIFLGSVLPSGRPTGSSSLPPGVMDYHDLLRGRVRGEHCMLVRRAALLATPYDETPGRDTPAVTWRRIARDHGVAVGNGAVIRYDDSGRDRVSDRSQSLRDPAQAAWCHRRMLEVFGKELRKLAPREWAEHVARAAFFDVLAGERGRAARGAVAALRVARTSSAFAALAACLVGERIARLVYARRIRAL